MHVRFNQTWDHYAVGLEHLGRRPDQALEVGATPQRNNLSSRDCHRLGSRCRGVACRDASFDEKFGHLRGGARLRVVRRLDIRSRCLYRFVQVGLSNRMSATAGR